VERNNRPLFVATPPSGPKSFLSPFSHFDVKVLEILKIHSNFHKFFEEPIFLNL